MEAIKCIRERLPGLEVCRFPNGRLTEVFVTVPAAEREEPVALLQRLYGYLEQQTALCLVRQDVFGVVAENGTAKSGTYRLDGCEWPTTWVKEGTGGGTPLSGILAHAVSGVEVHPLRVDGRVVGTVYEDNYARYCILAGLRPELPGTSRVFQARDIFARMEQALTLAGMDFSHVFRTWFYLDNILDWYGEFNQVRNRFFQERGVYDRLVPASTGVGGSNAAGTAVVADLAAVQLKDPRARLFAVPSPLQCPALDYGSSFSRAVELQLPNQRRLTVSGTASIAPGGQTLNVNDIDGQVSLSMEVVEAILKSRGMGWQDLVRGIAYFRHTEDIPAFHRYVRERGLKSLPCVLVKNDICRDDLLFEVEIDAISLTPPPQ